jgi:uncharacterized protein YfkK (UPF0435 family)
MCEFLAALFKSENTTNWIQALSAIAIFVLTLQMKNIAKQALSTWKLQKKHDIFTECAGMYSTYLAIINVGVLRIRYKGLDIVRHHENNTIEPVNFYKFAEELEIIKQEVRTSLKELGFFKNLGILKELKYDISREVELKDIYLNMGMNLEKIYSETNSYSYFTQKDINTPKRVIDKLIKSIRVWEDIEVELRQKAEGYNLSLT